MESKDKRRAIELLLEKKEGRRITYPEIALETGYTKRQLIRLSKSIDERGAEETLEHGNRGRTPSNTATEDEIRVIRELKRPYPTITITQLRDYYIEDVLENPERADEVERLGLRKRSLTWFGELFKREGWSSPVGRPPRGDGKKDRHPRRQPMPRRGMLCQVDATPYDWIMNGEVWNMHLAVDDATTEVLGAWFMESECLRGYSRMAKVMVERCGIPQAIYSDKDTVFRSAKGGGPTQFAHMMSDLGIRMVFANTPQAKGRVERYNFTVQNRLPNDVIRFGIEDYDTLNQWFNTFYIDYANGKFSFEPAEPESEFQPLDDSVNLSRVFRTRETRVVRGGVISYGNVYYVLVDSDGVIHNPGEGVKVGVFHDTITEEMYSEFHGKKFICAPIARRVRTDSPEGVQDRRELQNLLREMSNEGAARDL